MAKATLTAVVSASGKAEAVHAVEKVAAIDYTAFAAALAVCVADGASPTQAHVTTTNGAWATLKALIDAATGQVSANLVVTVDKANIGTISKLRAAFNDLLRAAEGSGQFTP